MLVVACADLLFYSTKALKDTKTFSVTAHLMKPSQSISVSITSVRRLMVLFKLCIEILSRNLLPAFQRLGHISLSSIRISFLPWIHVHATAW